MRRSFIRLILFGWLLLTFAISLHLLLSSSSPPDDPRGVPEDPVLRFQARSKVTTTPRWGFNPSKDERAATSSRLQLHPDPVKQRWELKRKFAAQVHTTNRTGWNEYFRFKNTGSDGHVWPKQGEMEDRILNQIHLVHSDPAGKKLKKILMYLGLDSGMRRGQGRFLDHGCPVNQCSLTDDMNEASTADAILFKDFVMKPLIQRSPDQIWILFLLESAVSRPSLESLANVVNWTATYRTDSTIVTPYERFTFYANYTSLPARAPKDYAKGKTKKVAWFVSNCGAANGRHNYVQELKKYIDVDVYGLCGTLTCYRDDAECDQTLRQYKFYLAFENSNCVDYITEKIYWNALGRNLSNPNDVVPVVMGARPEDYERLAPPGSYIHVDDFESPQALAEYLHKVDKDDELYNSYFRWKGTGDYIDTKFWCRLCAMIHEAQRTHHHEVYERLEEWWTGEGVCVSPPHRDGWASWRNDNATTSPLMQRKRRFNRNARFVRSWNESTALKSNDGVQQQTTRISPMTISNQQSRLLQQRLHVQ